MTAAGSDDAQLAVEDALGLPPKFKSEQLTEGDDYMLIRVPHGIWTQPNTGKRFWFDPAIQDWRQL